MWGCWRSESQARLLNTSQSVSLCRSFTQHLLCALHTPCNPHTSPPVCRHCRPNSQVRRRSPSATREPSWPQLVSVWSRAWTSAVHQSRGAWPPHCRGPLLFLRIPSGPLCLLGPQASVLSLMQTQPSRTFRWNGLNCSDSC